jgi:hypothetical protein
LRKYFTGRGKNAKHPAPDPLWLDRTFRTNIDPGEAYFCDGRTAGLIVITGDKFVAGIKGHRWLPRSAGWPNVVLEAILLALATGQARRGETQAKFLIPKDKPCGSASAGNPIPAVPSEYHRISFLVSPRLWVPVEERVNWCPPLCTSAEGEAGERRLFKASLPSRSLPH